MISFFKFHSKKTLILVNSTPRILNRAYSEVSSQTIDSMESQKRRNNFLNKYGLSNLNLVWPETINSYSEQVDYINKNPKSISQMYGESDLSKLPIFKGGFINFGYWPNPFFENGKITDEQRIQCSREMYRLVGDLAGILEKHNILDIGAGLGQGTAFFSEHYKPKIIVGLDISPDQIARAKKIHMSSISSGKLRFTIGEAESMPFTEDSFDRVVSVEAAQHFVSMSAFSKEAYRVLKPGGKLVITSFFPKNKEGIEALNAIVPDYHIHGSQNTIEEVYKELSNYMENVKISSIGENVWHGFSRWLDQIGYQNQWSKIWCALYDKGLIDYVVYEATTPKENVLLSNSMETPKLL